MSCVSVTYMLRLPIRDSNWVKHINIQYHFIREKVNTGQIEVIYIQTEEMAADGLTKPLSKVKFKDFTKSLKIDAF